MSNNASASPQVSYATRVIGVIVLVVIVFIALDKTPSTLFILKDPIGDLTSVFATLILASLFLERAIEVFLSAWRSGDADTKDQAIMELATKIEARVSAGEPHADLKGETDQLDALRMQRVKYSADSREIAQWLGLGMGVMIAFVGVRVLGNIVTPPAPAGGFQMKAFIVVDILLTGAVLAGGSDAINKIMKLYNSFMTGTEKKATANAQKAAADAQKATAEAQKAATDAQKAAAAGQPGAAPGGGQ